MEQYRHSLTALLLALVIIITGCTKNPIPTEPGGGFPPPLPQTHAFQVAIETLPALPPGQQLLYAVFNIVNTQQPNAVHDYKTPLHLDGKYLSDTLHLPAGNYQLSKLLVVDAQGKTLYASPLSGSVKAPLVQKPLAIAFTLPQTNFLRVNAEVLKIAQGDQPQQYGYPEGSFLQTGNEIPSPSTTEIQVQALIKIGDIAYDSIPASLQLTVWNEQAQPSSRYITLVAGKNTISLPNAATRYRLAIAKWGTNDEMMLEKNDVQAGTLYVLGGSKAAKKLKSEIAYQQLGNSAYAPISKNVYEYQGDGKLIKALYYLRKADNSPYLAFTENFSYNAAGKVERMVKYNEHQTVVSQTTFTYNPAGKLVNMQQEESGNQTHATVQYLSQPVSVGIATYNMHIKYNYSHQQSSTDYHLNLQHGNKVNDVAANSLQSGSTGSYAYDFNINPYAHMNWPDLNFIHLSINNRTQQSVQYNGHMPALVSYLMNYTYDSDGYPKEKVETFFSYPMNVYSHKIKTVYTY